MASYCHKSTKGATLKYRNNSEGKDSDTYTNCKLKKQRQEGRKIQKIKVVTVKS